MARRVFGYGEQGGQFVPIWRDGDDERREWEAVRRFVRRKGSAFVSGELDSGEQRNAGVLTWEDLAPMTLADFWEWLDEWARMMYRRAPAPTGADDDDDDDEQLDDEPAVVGATVMT